jgi:hypothetical protein
MKAVVVGECLPDPTALGLEDPDMVAADEAPPEVRGVLTENVGGIFAGHRSSATGASREVIVPSAAVGYFRNAGLAFRESRVRSASEVSPEELNALRRQGPY